LSWDVIFPAASGASVLVRILSENMGKRLLKGETVCTPYYYRANDNAAWEYQGHTKFSTQRAKANADG
jgi:hypothetical protein